MLQARVTWLVDTVLASHADEMLDSTTREQMMLAGGTYL
jgi:hypothetical protein